MKAALPRRKDRERPTLGALPAFLAQTQFCWPQRQSEPHLQSVQEQVVEQRRASSSRLVMVILLVVWEAPSRRAGGSGLERNG